MCNFPFNLTLVSVDIVFFTAKVVFGAVACIADTRDVADVGALFAVVVAARGFTSVFVTDDKGARAVEVFVVTVLVVVDEGTLAVAGFVIGDLII